MNVDAGVTHPMETAAWSSPSIESGDRVSDAGTEYGWNAPAGTGSAALGTRDPARPGSATRARAALRTDPTTNHRGRTIGPERYAQVWSGVQPRWRATAAAADFNVSG
jgi:hypothetical protein